LAQNERNSNFAQKICILAGKKKIAHSPATSQLKAKAREEKLGLGACDSLR
jgi:hypothetical protein